MTALVITAGHDLPVLLANTPKDTLLSYRKPIPSLPRWPATIRYPHRAHHSGPSQKCYRSVRSSCALSRCSRERASGRRLDRFLPPLDFDRARGAIAIAALTIFCFTFIQGASYDYRLLFLMGALAYLIEDVNQGINRPPGSYPHPPPSMEAFSPFIIGEILDASVFVMASLWLGNSLFYHGLQN